MVCALPGQSLKTKITTYFEGASSMQLVLADMAVSVSELKNR